jgi:hypothetical protein
VEILWMAGENPVDGATAKFFLGAAVRKPSSRAMCMRFRATLRLIGHAGSVEFPSLPDSEKNIFPTSVTRDVHRFEHSIAGHPYLIEVAAVAKDRWRAYIVHLPGMPTALMPFYGRTPDEAAEHLSAWLTRAHRASAPAGSV